MKTTVKDGRRRVSRSPVTAATIAADLMAEADRLQQEGIRTLSRARHLRKVAKGLAPR